MSRDDGKIRNEKGRQKRNDHINHLKELNNLIRLDNAHVDVDCEFRLNGESR